MGQIAIRTEKLTRLYRRSRRTKDKQNGKQTDDLLALNALDLEIREGELFGLLGPNGAGKTTLIKILTTLLAPSSGSAWVDGKDVVTHARSIRPTINMVSGGESCGYGVLNVEENLWLFSQIYGVSTPVARERIAQMLNIVGLAEKAKTRVSHLSTGQRQKMNFCRGFITDPKILFLDEPTLGLDVHAARAIRSFIKKWLAEKSGRTMLLTTHYMMEADELCDRLAIIDHGRVLACDTPSNLKRRSLLQTIFVLDLAVAAAENLLIEQIPGVRSCTTTASATSINVKLALEEESVIGVVVQHLVAHNARILNLKKVEPTLEDVFIELVGHGFEENGGTGA